MSERAVYGIKHDGNLFVFPFTHDKHSSFNLSVSDFFFNKLKSWVIPNATFHFKHLKIQYTCKLCRHNLSNCLLVKATAAVFNVNMQHYLKEDIRKTGTGRKMKVF